MDAPERKNPVATAPAAAVARPAKDSYTPPDNGKGSPMTDAPGEQASALDRKLTEGMNVLHLHSRLDRVERDINRLDQTVNRLDQTVNRLEHEFHEFRRETRAQFTRMEEARKADFDRLEEARKTDYDRLEEARKADYDRLEEARKADTAELKDMIRALTEQVQRNAEQTAIALERSAGLAWTQRRLTAGLLLLIAGAALGEIGQRVVAALFGG